MNAPDVFAPARVITGWRRFSMGLWRVPEGDIAAAYCADTFPKIRVFTHEGRKFTNCGASYSMWVNTEVRAYPLVSAEGYGGADSVPYSYEGRAVIYKGNSYRLGAETRFVSSEPAIEEWRRLLRSFFAGGGLLASGCDYREFLTGRCAPDSDNGRAAAALELADHANGLLPPTKEAMREWLDTGAKIIPTTQLAFNL